MLEPSDQEQRRRITVEQAEVEHTFRESRRRVRQHPELALPFGFENPRWEALKAEMRPGDELWECCTSRETWDALMGRAWIELVRDGEVVAVVLLAMN